MIAFSKLVKRSPVRSFCYRENPSSCGYMLYRLYASHSEGGPSGPLETNAASSGGVDAACQQHEGPLETTAASSGGVDAARQQQLDWEKCLEKQVNEWGELRKARLTASVFGFAIGFWEGRRVQLWKEKIGLQEPFNGNLATNWGTVKEAQAIQRYIELTNNKVSHQLFKSYPVGVSLPDWLGASPDGLINSKWPLLLDNGGILEVKCPFNKGKPQFGVPWPYVPYHYMPQAQGLMEIFDRNWMDFYVWTMNGSSIYRIDRNPDLWELMLTALNDFWWGHVVPARHALSKDANADVRRFRPGPHHALYLTIANKCKHVADKCPLLLNDEKPRLVR